MYDERKLNLGWLYGKIEKNTIFIIKVTKNHILFSKKLKICINNFLRIEEKVMNYNMRIYYDDFQSSNGYIFSIKHGACFEFMGCQVKFYQIPLDDKCIIVSCCGNTLSKDLAIEKMKNVLKLLSFLLAWNISTVEFSFWESDVSMEVNELLSKRSKKILHNIERKIQRFNVTADLFNEIMNLLSIAYENLFNYREEDAFVYFFKIIEKISKKHYLVYMQRHHTVKDTRENKSKLRNFIKSYSVDCLKVKLTENLVDRKVDMLYKSLKIEFYGSIFGKISLFIQRHKIKIDINIVSELVHIRNKIAHGDTIKQDMLSMDLFCCEYLANEMIANHFFNTDYLKLHFKSYRYFRGEDIYLL